MSQEAPIDDLWKDYKPPGYTGTRRTVVHQVAAEESPKKEIIEKKKSWVDTYVKEKTPQSTQLSDPKYRIPGYSGHIPNKQHQVAKTAGFYPNCFTFSCCINRWL